MIDNAHVCHYVCNYVEDDVGIKIITVITVGELRSAFMYDPNVPRRFLDVR